MNEKLTEYLNVLYEFTEGSNIQLIVGKLKDNIQELNKDTSVEDLKFINEIKN